MADYELILSRAIAAMPENTVATREEVYRKARIAIDRKLRQIDPPPPEEAISRQMAQLEAAIQKLEGEWVVAEAMADLDFDTGESDESESPPATPSAAPPHESAAPTTPLRGPVFPDDRPSSPENDTAESVLPPAAGEIAAQAYYPAAPASGRPPDPEAGPAEPTFAPMPPSMDERQAETRRREAPENFHAAREPREGQRDLSDPAAGVRGQSNRRRAAPAAKRRGFGAALTAIVVLVILAAGAYGAYFYRAELARFSDTAIDGIAALIGGDPTTEAPSSASREGTGESQSVASDDAENATEDGKDASRLVTENGGSDAPTSIIGEPDPPAGESDSPSAGDEDSAIRVEVPEQPSAADSDASEPAEVVVAEGETSGESDADAAGETAPIAEAVTGENAYLYEEASGSAGASRDEATIVWSLEQEPPEAGMPAEPVIKGMVDVPGRGLGMALTIKRNVDAALPASHIIELLFTAPPEFSGGNVDNVSRFVMKASEQARGESLIGVPARIDTGYFLIALNNLQQAQQTNRRLLLSSGWIDIPVSYVTGRRALVTLEKGTSGDAVFREAFDDWQNR